MTDVRPGWARLRERFGRSRASRFAARTLGVLYLLALLAPFLSPYGETEIDRDRFFHPPTPVRLRDLDGRWHLRPFVHGSIAGEDQSWREDRTVRHPVRWFVRGTPYRWLGLFPSDRHLFGVEAPGRILLWGADELGRDVFTRVLHGAQVSLTVGLLGILVSFTIGLLLGGLAGYVGGAWDALVMRTCELLLAVPGLYLVIALRGAFPVSLQGRAAYLVVVAVLSALGWAGVARVVRNLVRSLREREYVLAAVAAGASRWRILTRHLLPNTASYTVVAATLAVPGYLLGEVFLSFLGVGVAPPAASWGNMLSAARSLRVLTSFPWMLLAPGLAIFVTVLAFQFLGDGLRDALDPRSRAGEDS
jgi:peptide/nickel transport system permease protein